MMIEKILGSHLSSGQATVQSIGVIYGMMIDAVHPTETIDWPKVHAKIRASMPATDDGKWRLKLDKIKKVGWALHDGVARSEAAQ